ncbi:MAG: SpoIVB peptidase, partial [Hyphomonadaceae bacterium]|nr:SpoIVB peptidase [Clostridia bacterium]
YAPWKPINLHSGDYITSANQVAINTADALSDAVKLSKGSEMSIDVMRNGKQLHMKIRPVESATDSEYRLGLWVRDSTAGIGTLTFVDPEAKQFAALGHGITDIDTGAMMTVSSGQILRSSILSATKGLRGTPGELKGVFLDETLVSGDIKLNSEYGVYGQYLGAFSAHSGTMPIGLISEIKVGPAYILSNVEGTKVDKFEIQIEKVLPHARRSLKGMVIRVTDPRLLEKTGGIVQGMSGSPIIQNDKIVGAVTHVFVNDPTRGYGIFVEWMLKQIENQRISWFSSFIVA